jgi:hypothetical protein
MTNQRSDQGNRLVSAGSESSKRKKIKRVVEVEQKGATV